MNKSILGYMDSVVVVVGFVENCIVFTVVNQMVSKSLSFWKRKIYIYHS